MADRMFACECGLKLTVATAWTWFQCFGCRRRYYWGRATRQWLRSA